MFSHRRPRFSVWTIVAPIALVAAFAVSVMLVMGALDRPLSVPAGTDNAAATVMPTTVETFVAVDASVPAEYKIRKGDTLSDIADRYGVREDHIVSLNPGLDVLALIPGTRIRLK